MKSIRTFLVVGLSLMLAIPTLVGQNDGNKEYSSFGEEIDPGHAIGYQDLIESLQTKDSVEAKISAKVDEVCQMKGCWMNVSAPESNTPIFVQFKDYGFFVPMDISGKEVVMRGVAYKQMISVEDQQHYAKDAGMSADEIAKIIEPSEEITFMADGVLVRN